MMHSIRKDIQRPHGGGGRGWPDCGAEVLEPYLPLPVVERVGEAYRLVASAESIGRVRTFLDSWRVCACVLLHSRLWTGRVTSGVGNAC